MPEPQANPGSNEAAWREWSAHALKTALNWPRDKQILFTRDDRFRSLTDTDQERLWQAIQANGQLPPAAPVPPARTPAPLRTPAAIAPAKKPASPRRSWFKGELAYALRWALIYWLAILGGGLVILKLFAGG
jgi:hypothetical protein